MNHKQEINKAVEKFRKDVDKIRNSDNPIYKEKELQEYEIKALRADLDATVTELQNDFERNIEAQIADAEAKAQASRFYVSETQKAQAMHALDAFVADVTLAYDDNGKHSAYNTLERRLDDMTAAELAHIRLQLPSVLGRVNGDEVATKKLKSLNATLATLKTPEAERLDELKEAKRAGADAAFKRLRVTHPAFNDFRDNVNRRNF